MLGISLIKLIFCYLYFSQNTFPTRWSIRNSIKCIAIQNIRGQGYDRASKDDNSSNELVDLQNRNTFS